MRPLERPGTEKVKAEVARREKRGDTWRQEAAIEAGQEVARDQDVLISAQTRAEEEPVG